MPNITRHGSDCSPQQMCHHSFTELDHGGSSRREMRFTRDICVTRTILWGEKQPDPYFLRMADCAVPDHKMDTLLGASHAVMPKPSDCGDEFHCEVICCRWYFLRLSVQTTVVTCRKPFYHCGSRGRSSWVCVLYNNTPEATAW